MEVWDLVLNSAKNIDIGGTMSETWHQVTCGKPDCQSCRPKDDGVPKLHGWITPDYAIEMATEFVKFLRENDYTVLFKVHKNAPV